MTIVQKIQQAASALTSSERVLVQRLVDSPKQAALATASEFAREAGVHEATASRLARKLGYENYATFRRALQNEFLPMQEPATRIYRTISGKEGDDPLALLIEQERVAIADIPTYVTPADIENVATDLMAAQRLFVFAQGNAEVLAGLMVRRFRRFGRIAEQLSADPRHLAEQTLGLCADDVVLVFAFRRPPRAYRPLVETAKEAGAKTIAITGTIGPVLSPAPDRLIAVPRSGSPERFQSLTVPMTVCNAIVLSAASINREDSMRKLERLGELLTRFE